MGLTVAVSREAGSRGGTIASAAGRLLGWQVYDQEMLDFLARDEAARAEFLAEVPDRARVWADAEIARLVQARGLDPNGDVIAVARLVFTLAAKGEAVMVGRGAGFLLPIETTVNVRVIAPIEQRVAYMSQWLRLTESEAATEVHTRDRKRIELLATIADRDVSDPTSYDLFLNSARLGVTACAELIALAVRSKQFASEPSSDELA